MQRRGEASQDKLKTKWRGVTGNFSLIELKLMQRRLNLLLFNTVLEH